MTSAALRAVAALLAAHTLGGCIAAAIPAGAASIMVRKRMAAQRAQQAAAPIAAPAPAQSIEPTVPGDDRYQLVAGMKTLPAPGTIGAQRAPATATVPEGMQYLYGSGEGAALSVQAYQGLTAYLAARAADAKSRRALRQVVLSDGASLNAPHFDPCGDKPMAAVFDIDETAILNLGYEVDAATRGGGYDDQRWQRWEASGAGKVVAVPGAVAAVNAARAAGVVVIFNSNRTGANAAQTADALDHAGFGAVKHGTTLWLKGDDGGGSGKDDRRWAIASGYCVVALVGDQLGDFSDLFNDPKLTPSTRRALAGSPQLAGMWGNGWFVLPNPVYGSGLRGGIDDVFPLDMRWDDPGATRP